MTAKHWPRRDFSFVLLAGTSLALAPDVAGAQGDTSGSDASAVEEVVVTGTRIKRRDFSSISPLTTVNLTDIEFSGRPTLEELLNRMPQVAPGFGRASNNPGDGTAQVNLRGLGAGRTLVLINGRRLAPSGVGSAVDVNNLPQALVERVEIITGGATAVYGSDAIAGVVNFITRDDFQGLSVNGSFGITEEGDGETRDLNVAYGHDLPDDRGNVVFYAGVLEREALFASEREFTRIDLEDDWRGNLSPRGSFRVPELLIFAPIEGGIFPIFNKDGTFRDFIDPDDRYNFAPINYLQIPLERVSAGITGDYSFAESLEAYVEISYANNESRQNTAEVPAGGTLTVNLDNPLLAPVTRDMLADNFMSDPGFATFPYGRRMSEFGPRISDHTRDYWRTVVGLRGPLVGDWEYDAWLSSTDLSETETMLNDVSRSRLDQGLLVDPATNQCFDPSGGCVPVNVFGAGNISAEAVEFLRIDQAQNETDRRQTLVSFFATGPLGTNWAGEIDAAFGMEWRRDQADFKADDVLFTGDTLGFHGESSISGAEEVLETYGEAVIPLAGALSGADYLGLELGARYSDYKLAGGNWTYKVGAEWVPRTGLRLRAMHQRSVRAPNVSELFEERFAQPGPLVGGRATDPCSASSDPVATGAADKCIQQGIAPSQIGIFEAPDVVFGEEVRGGNFELKPEKADTFTVGAVLDLEALPKWSFAFDYFRFDVEDTIGAINSRAICYDRRNTAALFCDNIIRDSSGNMAKIVNLTENRGLVAARGIDTQLRYRTDLPDALTIGGAGARIAIDMIWSHLLQFKQQENPVTQVYDCAGRFGWPCYDGEVFNGAQTFAENRVTTYANYSAGPWSMHLTWRWIEGTDNAAPLSLDFQTFDDPVLATPDVSARSYVDAGVGYRFRDRFSVRLNINNLFDTKPPQMANAVLSNNTDTGTYDVFGRSFFLSFSADFGR